MNKGCCVSTTHIKNNKGEMIAWDTIRDAIHVPAGTKAKPETLSATEAAKEFGVSRVAIYRRAERYKWRLLTQTEKNKLLVNWPKRGEAHRELAYEKAHESVKKFKIRAPANFRELEAADKIARRAAGLDTAEMIQQTLVHINEEIEAFGEAQVIEADSMRLPDQEGEVLDAEIESIEDTGESTQGDSATDQSVA
jgi:predicted DNA-binding protein YlxM (UPF0122 family)